MNRSSSHLPKCLWHRVPGLELQRCPRSHLVSRECGVFLRWAHSRWRLLQGPFWCAPRQCGRGYWDRPRQPGFRHRLCLSRQDGVERERPSHRQDYELQEGETFSIFSLIYFIFIGRGWLWFVFVPPPHPESSVSLFIILLAYQSVFTASVCVSSWDIWMSSLDRISSAEIGKDEWMWAREETLGARGEI